jgi:hypothetical protein
MAESMTKEEEQQLAQQLLRTPMMGAPVNSRPTASIPQPPAQQQNPLMNTAQSGREKCADEYSGKAAAI